MEIKHLMIGMVLVFFLTAGLVSFYSDIAYSYNTSVKNLTTAKSYSNFNDTFSSMQGAVNTNSTTQQVAFGQMNLLDLTQWYKLIMFFFQMPNTFTTLITDLTQFGLGVDIGWAVAYIELLFLITVVLAIAGVVWRWWM